MLKRTAVIELLLWTAILAVLPFALGFAARAFWKALLFGWGIMG